jgi:SAM-dependent methyltransferase
MKTIENTLRHQVCPLCHCNSILFQGPIGVEIPTYYSTTQIKLSRIPELWKCQECESSFTQNAIHEEDAIKLYSQGSSQIRWTNLQFEKAKTSLVVSKLESLLKPEIKVLDIGCGSGTFLDFAKAKRCSTSGVEYSCSSLANITQRGHAGFSDLSQVNETFDLITAFDLVEHLYDLSNFLKSCKSKLSSDGCLVILTGDISSKPSTTAKSNWWYVKFPEHVVFPSQKYFIQNSGLKISDWISTYNSPEAQTNLLISSLKIMYNFIRNRKYDGASSVQTDHCLIVLKNEPDAVT